MMTRRWAVVVAAGVLMASVEAADTGTLRIEVVDSEGAVIGGALISMRPDRTGRPSPIRVVPAATAADQQGRLTSELEPGFFDVCVMADAFVPTCQKVRVVTGATKSIRVRLTIDPAVIREIGDTFPTRGR